MKFSSEAQKKKFVKKVQAQKGKLPEFDEIVKLLKQGMKQSQIAKKYGVSRQSVNNKIKKELNKPNK